MAKHTPGDWQVGFDDGSGQTYIVTKEVEKKKGVRKGLPVKSIARVRWGCGCCENFDPLTEEEKANLRLLASAPRLLESLKELVYPPLGGPTSKEILKAQILISEVEGE